MIRAVGAEFLKLSTTRLWWILLIILLVYVGFTAALLAGLFGSLADEVAATPGAPQLPATALPAIVYSSVTAVGYVFPVLLGALATTAEFRNQTLTPTFLATPRRGTVLGAKLITLAAFGALYGLGGLAVSVGLGAPILDATGTPAALDEPDTWWLAVRVVIAMTLWAIIGVGLGVLVPNQVAAIVIVLAFTQFVEPILRFGSSIWEWAAQLGRFLPGSASDALVGSSIFSSLSGTASPVEPLDWWQGGLVLLGIAAVTALVGYLTTWRRDVT